MASMSPDAPTVLIIDDEEVVARALGRVLRRQGGYTVRTAATGEEGLAMAAEFRPEVALVDLQMPGMYGTEVVRRMREFSEHTECVVITGHGNAKDAFEVLRLGASDYFEKPIEDWARFIQVIRQAVRIRELKKDNERLRADQSDDGFDRLIGKSAAMRKLKDLILTYAPHDVPVLITGESGTGKERVAKAIHARSSCAEGPFIAVNCGAIPENLVESQLFGAVKGAYSGAIRDTPGFFGAAAGGTLFLDEVGELPLASQPKLLRVLQEREFQQVGGARTRKMTARIIAATHQDLPQRVRDGTFREDLYHRLRVLYLDVPPLRDRQDDIRILTWFFVQKLSQQMRKEVTGIDHDAMAALERAVWQNNVRELENTLLGAVVLSTDSTLRLEHFRELEAASAADAPDGPRSAAPSWFEGAMDMDWSAAKEEVERQFGRSYCIARLKATGFNITRAAEMAGMQRPNFKRLMRRFGIEKPADIDSEG